RCTLVVARGERYPAFSRCGEGRRRTRAWFVMVKRAYAIAAVLVFSAACRQLLGLTEPADVDAGTVQHDAPPDGSPQGDATAGSAALADAGAPPALVTGLNGVTLLAANSEYVFYQTANLDGIWQVPVGGGAKPSQLVPMAPGSVIGDLVPTGPLVLYR